MKTHIIHPALALLGQVTRPNRDDRVVVLEVVRVESEEVDQSV